MRFSRPHLSSLVGRKRALRLIAELVLCTLMASVGALVDLVRHPEIPYLDEEHLVAGSITALVVLALIVVLEIYLARRNRADEALRQSEERHRQLAQSARDWIWEVDEQGVYTYAGPKVDDLLGYTPEEMLGKTPFDFMPPAEAERVASAFMSIAANRETFRDLENTNLHKDGHLVVLATTGLPIFDSKGEFRGYRGIDHDVTEHKRAEHERVELERRLQQSQRMESLGILAGGVAHEFNNILTIVLGNAELALSKLPATAPIRENLREITQASRRAAGLCRQMLDFSGRGHFVIELVNLRTLVENMLGLLTSAVPKNTVIDLDLDEGSPPLFGDLGQLSQVVTSLVLNGAEAIGDRNGTITISVAAKECSSEYLRGCYSNPDLAAGPYVVLEVSDNGCGMDAETQQRLFEPFFTTKFAGRGLGLPALLGIVRGHKGALKVFSEEGKGSTFTIYLPAAHAGDDNAARVSPSEAEDWVGQGTVLLVDDEEAIREMGKRMLSSLGFSVLTAADGREAITLYADHPSEIALVLLDLTMAGMDSQETFSELCRLNPEVRVVMSSGYSEPGIAPRLAGRSPVGFIQKPYTMDQLKEGLRAALNN